MTDDTIRAALREAALTMVREYTRDDRREPNARDERVGAAAVAAFLRALPEASIFIHGQALKTTNCIDAADMAAAVERAARGGEG